MPHLSVLALKRCHLYSHHVFKVGGGAGFGLVMACRALPQIFNIVWGGIYRFVFIKNLQSDEAYSALYLWRIF